MYKWKRAKGIWSENKCSKCGIVVHDSDFSFEDDMCHLCLFPESSDRMPVPLNFEQGEARNVTPERELLDNLDYTPEKQSKAAKESLERFKKRKLYKGLISD